MIGLFYLVIFKWIKSERGWTEIRWWKIAYVLCSLNIWPMNLILAYFCQPWHDCNCCKNTKEAINQCSTFSRLMGWIWGDARRQGDKQTDRQTDRADMSIVTATSDLQQRGLVLTGNTIRHFLVVVVTNTLF